MKKICFSLLILSMMLGACGPEATSDKAVQRKLSGSGIIVEEQRKTNGFRRVSLHGGGVLEIVPGEEEMLIIKADDNLLPHIITKVQGSKLSIRFAEGIDPNPTRPVELSVTAESLTAISVSGVGIVEASELQASDFSLSIAGAGDATIAGLVSDSLEVNIQGSGNAHFESLDVKSIRANISGTGNVTIENGKAEEQKIAISGTGNYEAEGVESARAEVHLAGTGTAALHVADHLEIDMSGACLVRHIGAPEIDANISGTGLVRRIDNEDAELSTRNASP